MGSIGGLQFTDSVICYKEYARSHSRVPQNTGRAHSSPSPSSFAVQSARNSPPHAFFLFLLSFFGLSRLPSPLSPPLSRRLIDKEDTARRNWKERYGKRFAVGGQGWRPVEPFEKDGASDAKTELPAAIPVSAIRNPPLYRDTVGNEGLAGGTPLRFGGQWDVVSQKVERWVDPNKPPRQVKKGPHDCYCDVGYNCWNMAGKARTANYGLMGTFEREFWTNTPGELALVWDYSKEREKRAAAPAPAPAK